MIKVVKKDKGCQPLHITGESSKTIVTTKFFADSWMEMSKNEMIT